MNAEELRRSRELWRKRERDALKLWRSRQQRLDADDPRRAQAFRAYRKAQAMRRRRDTQIEKLPITCMDAAGRRALIREEGVRRFAYNDSFRSTQYPHGHATFGVGRLLHLGAVTDADRARWGTPARPLSMKVVNAVLTEDLERFEAVVRSVFAGAKLKPTQAMFNACVSLAFNIGPAGFSTSTVARRIRSGDKQGAANAIMLWDHPPELRGRRGRERAMFLSS